MATKKILTFRIEVEGVSKEAEKIVQIDQALNKLNAERKESLALLKSGQKTQQEHSRTLAQIASKTKDLQVQKSALNRTERLSAQAFKASAGSMEELRRRTAQLREQANRLNTTTREGQRALRAKRAEIIANTKSIRDYDRAMSGSSTLVGEYSRGIVRGFKAIAGGIIAAVAVVRTFQRVIGGSVKAFAEFETSITNVQTLLDETDEMLSTRSIALMRQYGTEITDTNKAMFDAISAGISTGDSYEFMSRAAELAIGGVTSLSIAVDGMTSIMNAYGLEIAEAKKVAAAFFSAQKFGKTEVSELAENIGQVAPVAKLANVSYQELLATYAELTKQGIKTELANTAIRATILAVIKPSEQARAKFKSLGIETGLLAVKEQGLFTILEKISKEAEKNADSLTELIPNVRALTGIGALGTEQLEDYHKILETVNNDFGEGSSLINAYNIQMATANKRWDLAKARVRELAIELGGKLAPSLLSVLEALLPYRTEDPAFLAAENINRFSNSIKDLNREGQIEQIISQMGFYRRRLGELQTQSLELAGKRTLWNWLGDAKGFEENKRMVKFLNEQMVPQLEIGVKDLQELYDKLLAGGTVTTPTPEGEDEDGGVTTGIPIGPTATQLAAFQIKMQEFYEKQFALKVEKQVDALAAQQDAIDAELRLLDESINKEIALEERKYERKDELRQRDFDKEKAEFLRKKEIYDTFSNTVLQITNETIAQGELSMKKFGEIVVISMLDLLRKIILMKQVEILARALVSPESLATFGIAGVIKAAIINSIVTAAFGAVKAKVSGKLEEGGEVQSGSELPGMPRGGDNTLILAKPGEVMLNKQQQALLGGPDIFRRIGVPGFAAGGVVPEPDLARLESPDLTGQITAAFGSIPVVLDMHEVREANDKLDVIAETTGV